VLATYALYPLVHTAARDRALIIGLGSGATAQIVQRATSGQVDVVEGSMNIIHLARAHFAASSMPHIEVIHSEVRRFFALNTTEYDLLFIGPSPIWLPDGTHVYHREFYRHAKARLRPRGVFEQGLPLDQLRADDLVAVLATIRVEFPRIWLYATGAEGALVACNHDCAPTPATTQSLPDARQLLSDRLLSPDEVDKLLADVNARGVDLERLVSTDDNALLEFAATRRVAGDDERTFKNNLTLLRSFMPSSIFAGTRLSEKDLRAPRLERSPPESDEPRSLGPLAPDDGVGR
jgi:hypothetical protein